MPPQAAPVAPASATGNPFLQGAGPGSATVAPRVDRQVQPASFDQPIPAPMPTTAGNGLTPVVMPATAVLPQPVVPPPAAVAPPQALGGLALLTARPTGAAAQAEHPLAPVIRWADDALRQMQGLRDYTGTFVKREWVDGRLQDQQVMYAKVRQAPFSVYLQFLAPADVKGQEALYVVGQNDGNLLAHPVGFKQALVGTISLAPNAPQAMEGNRYPITDFGVRRLLERYLEGAILDSQFGECDVQIIENAAVNDRPCTCIQVVHPQPRREFRFYLCRLYVDNQWNVPVRCETYDWPKAPGQQPQLVEEYTYAGLRLNAGLSDADFDRRNPNYRF
jgi:hypothetical protein